MLISLFPYIKRIAMHLLMADDRKELCEIFYYLSSFFRLCSFPANNFAVLLLVSTAVFSYKKEHFGVKKKVQWSEKPVFVFFKQ